MKILALEYFSGEFQNNILKYISNVNSSDQNGKYHFMYKVSVFTYQEHKYLLHNSETIRITCSLHLDNIVYIQKETDLHSVGISGLFIFYMLLSYILAASHIILIFRAVAITLIYILLCYKWMQIRPLYLRNYFTEGHPTRK